MEYRILCIGNSHTAGFPHFDPQSGGNPESTYQFWLNRMLKQKFSKLTFIFDNKGICGQTSREITQRLKISLKEAQYDLVLYWGGANDIVIGIPSNLIWRNILEAIELAREAPVDCVILTIPPMNWPGINDIVISINKKIKKSENSFKSYIIADVYKALEKQGSLNTLYDAGDGAHLSIEGYKSVGKIIFQSILQLINK